MYYNYHRRTKERCQASFPQVVNYIRSGRLTSGSTQSATVDVNYLSPPLLFLAEPQSFQDNIKLLRGSAAKCTPRQGCPRLIYAQMNQLFTNYPFCDIPYSGGEIVKCDFCGKEEDIVSPGECIFCKRKGCEIHFAFRIKVERLNKNPSQEKEILICRDCAQDCGKG